MVIYKNILEKLKDAGYNTSTLRRDSILSESTITRIRNNQPITTETLNTICTLLKCRIEDVVDIIPDSEQEGKDKGI